MRKSRNDCRITAEKLRKNTEPVEKKTGIACNLWKSTAPCCARRPRRIPAGELAPKPFGEPLGVDVLAVGRGRNESGHQRWPSWGFRIATRLQNVKTRVLARWGGRSLLQLVLEATHLRHFPHLYRFWALMARPPPWGSGSGHGWPTQPHRVYLCKCVNVIVCV